MHSKLLAAVLLALSWSCSSSSNREKPPDVSVLLKPGARELLQKAPDFFLVKLETTKGEIVIDVHRDWSPQGADRFYNLVRAGYYDGVRFHRVVEGRWAQFGIQGDPEISQTWRLLRPETGFPVRFLPPPSSRGFPGILETSVLRCRVSPSQIADSLIASAS